MTTIRLVRIGPNWSLPALHPLFLSLTESIRNVRAEPEVQIGPIWCESVRAGPWMLEFTVMVVYRSAESFTNALMVVL